MTKELKAIGVAGQKQNGKDTLADYMATRLFYTERVPHQHLFHTERVPSYRQPFLENNRHWGRGSFASEVKRIFCETFMFEPALIDEWKVKSEPPPGFDKSVRQSLMMIGDGFREIMGDIWIRRAFEGPSPFHKIFSDIRYLNEAKKIHEVGGPNILICHPERINFTANRSESELRPYILWCNETGREGRIASWPEFQALCQQDGRDEFMYFPSHDEAPSAFPIRIPTGEFAENLSLFDLFIRNDGDMEGLFSKVDSVVIPYLKSDFGYQGENEQD